jgi:hypothetical protein
MGISQRRPMRRLKKVKKKYECQGVGNSALYLGFRHAGIWCHLLMPIVFSICLIARVVGTFFASMRLKTRRLKATQSLTEVFSSWRRGKQDTCRRWVSSGVVGFPEVVANVWAILESSSSCFHSSLGQPSQRN